MTPVYLTMQMQNTHAFTVHAPLPYIVVVSLFLFVFPGGAGATLPLAGLLAISRVPRLRRVGRATFLPALFNLNEPLLFAAPVVFNPHLVLPFVGAPLVLATVTYVVGRARDSSRARRFTCRLRCRRSFRRTSRRRTCARLRSPRSTSRMATLSTIRSCAHTSATSAATHDRSSSASASASAGPFAMPRSQRASAPRRSRYEPQRRVHAQRTAAFIDEGLAESDLAGSTGYGYDDRGAGALRVAAGAHPRRGARDRASLDRERYARHRCRACGVHAAGNERFSRSPGRPTIRCATRSATRRTRWSARGSRTAKSRWIEAAQSICARSRKRLRKWAMRPFLFSVRAGTHRGGRSVCKSASARFARSRRSHRAPTCSSITATASSSRNANRRMPAPISSWDRSSRISADRSRRPVRTLPGSAQLVERVAARFYAPGLGTSLGPSLGFGRELCQGLFLAPLVVEQSLRGLDFTAALFEALGYRRRPEARRAANRYRASDSSRFDGVVSALCRWIAVGDAGERAFSAGARRACPAMREPVIMSSGAFVSGATIELSCDAPMRPPFEVYVQGGVSVAHAYLGALFAARACEA